MPRSTAPRPLLLLLLLAACSGGGGATPTVTPGPGRDPALGGPARRVMLATGYTATAVVERRDSIFIALPDGSSQVQQVVRHLRFAVRVAGNGEVVVRLDSLAATPATAASPALLVGTRWTGRLTRDGLSGITTRAGEAMVEFIGGEVAALFPAIPRGGVPVGSRWEDSTGGDRQIEIFRATDQRRAQWRVGEPIERGGIEVLPVTVREAYEQLGRGEQTGREMRMSAQGVRSATYYVTTIGRIDAMVARDSAQRLITIPSTRQAIPTTQVVRTEVRWEIER